MVMKQGQGLLRRNVKLGVFVAGLVLALSLPGIAFAANTTVFSSLNPAAGSITTMSKPTISVIGFDRYGVKGVGKATMTLDGVPVPRTFRWLSGWGFRKFKMTYVVPNNLSLGSHKVVVRIQDLRGLRSRKTWDFTVDAAPVTTSNALTNYTSTATINLSATDNVAVANTFYWLDSGAPVSGTVVNVSTIGSHLLRYWSVDTAGNVEETNWRVFAVSQPIGVGMDSSHAAPAIACTVSGCHDGGDVATIHLAAGCAMCHGTGVTPTTDCITCHGATPANHTAETHPSIASTDTPACSQASCHGSSAVVTIHTGGCAVCHGTSNPVYNAAIASGNASCESCHTDGFDAIHGVLTAAHAVTGAACFNSNCHPSDAADIHTVWATPAGCVACHTPGVTPSLECSNCHNNIATVHGFAHADATGTQSSACTDSGCHGTDLPTAHAAVGCVCHSDTTLVDTMTPLLEAGMAECVDCHVGEIAAHGFEMTASGHNTTTYGTVGGYSKFDGSQGPVIKWESEIASSSLVATYYVEGPTGNFPPVEWPTGVTEVTVGQEGTMTTLWNPAQKQVFWASDDASAPVTAVKGLDWDSVISCQDCHAGLSAAGPHGAADNWALDPNYAGDYSMAELTKYVTSNNAYSATDFSEPNRSNYLVPLSASGIAMRPDNDFPLVLRDRTDGTTGANAVICSKCHDLMNVVDYGNGQSAAIGSNTAHNSHHQDQVDGSAQCVSCHVGIPHGWKRPRLLVNTDVDTAPYLDPMAAGTTRTNNGVQMYRMVGGVWVAQPVGGTGFNLIGMQSLSAVDPHVAVKDYATLTGRMDGKVTPADLNTVGTDDMVFWSEASCQACNDHTGEDGIRILESAE